jgi:lipopolysaccharide heptosyltransferase II
MKQARRILFITLSNIGDLVMTTPLLEALHMSFPEHLIDIVADARSSDLLRACPYRGRLLHKDKRADLRTNAALIMDLRETAYDVAVDLRTAFLTFLIRCGQRGLKRRGTSLGPLAVHHHFTALRAILGTAVEIPAACIWLDTPAQARALELLKPQPAERLLVLAPGANWPGKVWPLQRFADLVERLSDSFDRAVVVGSAQERALGETLAKHSAIPVTNLAGSTDLLEVAAVIAHACAFVGNDSGLGHIAAALQVPTLTVFGPGQPDRYRPWGTRAAIVLAPNEDLPALDAQTVATALRRHLSQHAGSWPDKPACA